MYPSVNLCKNKDLTIKLVSQFLVFVGVFFIMKNREYKELMRAFDAMNIKRILRVLWKRFTVIL